MKKINENSIKKVLKNLSIKSFSELENHKIKGGKLATGPYKAARP